ncbi:DJ-1/PfpI family protein [Sinosporangium siamense]|uniref:Glutamine amidotransferase n=1 Tax=Sinosporangium siamense TaxID=1367973 RepID=A0A919V707_9ACTN|nr:DJ-1/PfpI family protein [Sinosporangium siamense]GII94620.1 glutamine amidotransferase [Sinosporangium siamense]
MDVAILIYEGFTALDVTGPFEVLSRLPAPRVRFVSAIPGMCPADQPGFGLVAEPLESMAEPDLIVVSGGSTTQRFLSDEAVLTWLRRAHQTSVRTTSVCTGALLLGAAGLLEGREATTHWYELESLRCFGATPTSRRVVEDGKIITAAGVSSGIDMALLLCDRLQGPAYAQAVQLAIEYDPQPPHDAGSVSKAPAEVVRFMRDDFARSYGPSWAERCASSPGGDR